ncbi:MAG: IS256 family transposase [Lysobacterales bacterium]
MTTNDSMAFEALIEKTQDTDFVRELLSFAAHRLMEWEAQQQCGAGFHEKSSERITQRNGYRDRTWMTRTGDVDLRIPKLRQGTYLPSFIDPRKTSEKALVAVTQEAYIKGVSTRSVDDLVQALGGSGISKSQVSRLCGEIDERVQAFLTRPLEGDWPFVWLDATYIKSREGGRVVSRACIVAVGANGDGRREVLGLTVGPSEAETFWTSFLRSLIGRGLAGVKLVISDAHGGLKAAITQVLQATWQRCRVHFMRNALQRVPKKQQAVVSATLRTVFAQDTVADAHRQWREVADTLRPRFPKLAELLDDAEYDVLAYMNFPKEIRAKIHSTNPIERVNREIKRRTNVVGIFPNDEAIVRWVGALMLEQNDEWAVCRRYMSLEAVALLCDDQTKAAEKHRGLVAPSMPIG